MVIDGEGRRMDSGTREARRKGEEEDGEMRGEGREERMRRSVLL